MKNFLTFVLAIFLANALLAQNSNSSELANSKATLAISKIEATEGIQQKARRDGTTDTLKRVIESLNSNALAAIQQTRKFELVSRDDLDAIMKEISFADSGNVASDKNAPQAGKLKGAKFILAISISDFQDYVEKAHFATLEKLVERRILRFGVVAKLIDTQTGAIFETVRLDISNNDVSETDAGVVKSGNLNDALISQMSNMLADKIALKICDIAFPAKVAARTGKFVTINRGEGAGVALGEIYDVFAVGKNIIDPDTGENLGVEEIYIGKIKITRVMSKMSQGEVVEDNGIDIGQVARFSGEK